MHASSMQKLILLLFIVGHFNNLCVARRICGAGSRRTGCRRTYPRRPPPTTTIAPCLDLSLCKKLEDCLLPPFKCILWEKCIPRSWRCNGIPDCRNGSDEWGCETTSLDSTTTSTMHSESIENYPLYISTTSTMRQYTEVETATSTFTATNVIFPESEENTPSPSSTTSTMVPDSESNIASLSSSTISLMLPESESNTVSSSLTATSTMLPESESNTVSSSLTTTSMMLPESKSNTASSSLTTTSTMLPESESNTNSSSSLTASTSLYGSESNTALSSSSTTKTILPTSGGDKMVLPKTNENTSSPTTNLSLPDSRERQSCSDNYCMQNAECIVDQGQYRCKCPSSFIGELCEIQLRTEQSSQEYVVAIVIFIALVILCVSVVSVCIYRYKRLSARKSSAMTTRTLSQLTLTSNAVE